MRIYTRTVKIPRALLREWPPVCSPSTGIYLLSPEGIDHQSFYLGALGTRYFKLWTQHWSRLPARVLRTCTRMSASLFPPPVKLPRAILSGWFKNNRYNRDSRAVLLSEATPNADPQNGRRTSSLTWAELPMREDFVFNGSFTTRRPASVISIIYIKNKYVSLMEFNTDVTRSRYLFFA